MDYLEKIFQIPFHLRPMGEAGFRALVDKLTAPSANGDAGHVHGGTGGSPRAESSTAESKGAAEGASLSEDGRVAGASSVADGQTGDGQTGMDASDGPTGERSGAVTDGGGPGGVDGASGPQVPAPDKTQMDHADGATRDPVAEGEPEADPGATAAGDDARRPRPRLDIADWERHFMSALHPFIGSPRSTKRFINVYRVVRSAHLEVALSSDDVASGAAVVEDAAHRHVLFLLAMLTGFPGPSIGLFR
jgi:hypothetical protein